jgi:hypothetical protein
VLAARCQPMDGAGFEGKAAECLKIETLRLNLSGLLSLALLSGFDALCQRVGVYYW